jgi:serine protease Do
MRQWTSWVVSVAVSLACSAGAAHALDESKLKNLQAPPPAPVTPLTGDIRPVKFAKLLIQLKPEPWAFLRNKDTLADDKLLTWQEGQKAVNPQAYAAVFEEEMKAANGKDTAGGGLFVQEASTPDLLVAAKITDMEGRFCRSCGLIMASGRWEGSVVMSTHWEVFSALERQVLATADITGGYNAPGRGVDGEPEQFIIQAFRDNVRRFIATEGFRKAVSTPAAPQQAYTAILGPITLVAAKPKPGVAQASASVAVVFTETGSGSGFLISDNGYLLTNHHVVGASRIVKLKWADGSETTGQVIRSDPGRDVALIRTDPGARAALGMRHTPVQQGETVFAIGSPLGDRFQNTMSKGIVSALRNQQGLTFIQSDVMVNHGSSGGPLIDDSGQVIGLTASGQMLNGSPVGINFFIPIDDALKTLYVTAPAETPSQVAVHKP